MNNENTNNSSDGIKDYVKANRVKCRIVCIYLILAILGLILSRGVKINYNLSDYLGKDTETSIALKIMTDEFGMTGNVQVMLSGIEKAEANDVKSTLAAIDGVLSVAYDEDSQTSYKEDTKSALFTILIDGEDHSDTAKQVIADIKSSIGEKYGAVELGGSTIEYNALRENTGREMGFIIVLSVALAALLLLVTASSWLEPIILLLCSGIAIAINMGLNLFFGEISYITNSVSSILQLALSVDYSIVLIHAYRDEKKTEPDNNVAMRRAVKMVISPVSASALTTIAGLVALLFMSFTIGFDIGIVLIKGIVVSAICAMTLLPVVILMLDPLLEKTSKKPFIPKGSFFSGLAFKWNKAVVPVVAIAIILSAVLQSFNSYGFTDSIGTNQKIVDTFGRNDSIVIVYKSGNRNEDYQKEAQLQKLLASYKNDEGKAPLASYTAYTTTVRELYTLEKATKALGLPEDDVKMLFTMYNLYTDRSALKLYPDKFIEFTNDIIASDEDVQEMVSEEMKKTIDILEKSGNIMSGSYTSAELYNRLLEISPSASITKFAIDQMYGLYYYDQITNPKINAREILYYLIDNEAKLKHEGMLSEDDSNLIESVKLLKNYDLSLGKNNVTFQNFMNSSFTYDRILPELQKVIPKIPGVNATAFDASLNDSIQQLYIMYFNENTRIPTEKLSGNRFVKFVLNTARTNSTVDAHLSKNQAKASLNDLVKVYSFMSGAVALDFSEMASKLDALRNSISTVPSGTSVSEDVISGVYIKYAIKNNIDDFNSPMMAFELLNFISANMKTNALLVAKMTDEHHKTVESAKNMVASAEGLFIGREYSRVLISAVLPAEGPEMVAFIDYLLDSVDKVFGEDAHITGKVVSTYDLQAAFNIDNTIITVFTILSILLVILFIFKSLSLPVLLVLVIQGAVWISLSFNLIDGGLIFFMSYIMTSCILMGATVDYGILMSSNYLVYRKTMTKGDALKKAVDSAMPTVFTSGVILIVCGVVISIISSQNSIASVGMLLARGALTSIVMITVGLPSILYLLDGFILKFTMTDKQNAIMKGKILDFLINTIDSLPSNNKSTDTDAVDKENKNK